MGWLTAFVSDTTLALVADGTLLGPRQFDMGNSGLDYQPSKRDACFGRTMGNAAV